MNLQAALFAYTTPSKKKKRSQGMQLRYSKQRPSSGRHRRQACRGTTFFDQDKSPRQTLADNTGAVPTGNDMNDQPLVYTKPDMVEKLSQGHTNQVVIGDQTFRVLANESFPRNTQHRGQEKAKHGDGQQHTKTPRGENKTVTTTTAAAAAAAAATTPQPLMTSPLLTTKKQSKLLPENSDDKKHTKPKLKKPALWQEPGVPSFIFFGDETSIVSPVSCVSMPKDTKDKHRGRREDRERGLPCSVIAVLHHLDNACSVLTTSADGSTYNHEDKQEGGGDDLGLEYVPRDYSPVTVGDEDCF